MEYEELAPFAYDLEQWMSFLSTAQPWLEESQNLRNRALFLDASHAIYTSIFAAEQSALEAEMPVWLRRLVDDLSEAEASVLTFNYDLLLERATLAARRALSFSELYVAPVVDRRRPGTGSMFSRGTSNRSVMELFKLHGSINWLTQASSSSGASSGLYTDQDSDTWKVGGGDGQPRTRYRDLSRMVVPPVATKDSFYSNEALNAQWKMAAARLAECKELVICGYSFPATDYSTRALIRQNLSTSARITVIDPAGQVQERVRALLGSDDRVIESFNAVTDYVDTLAVHVVEWGAAQDDAGRYTSNVIVDGIPLPQAELPNLDGPDTTPYSVLETFIQDRWPTAIEWRSTSNRLGHNGGIGTFRT